MPLTDKQIQAIEKQAEVLVANYENKDEAAKVKERYIRSTIALNTEIENVLDDYETASLPLLRDLYPGHPVGVLSVCDTQKNRLRDFCQSIIACLEPIKNMHYKCMTADTIHDLIEAVVSNHLADDIEELKISKELH